MKRGFTLIEVLGVIILVSLVTLLALPALLGSISNKEKSISNANKEVIYLATDLYISNNLNSFPKYEDSIYCITLGTLVSSGNLTKDIYTNNLDDNLDNTTTVKLHFKKGVFEKEIVKANECSKHIIITINKNDHKLITSYINVQDNLVCSSNIDGEVLYSDDLSLGNHTITCSINQNSITFDAIVTE